MSATLPRWRNTWHLKVSPTGRRGGRSLASCTRPAGPWCARPTEQVRPAALSLSHADRKPLIRSSSQPGCRHSIVDLLVTASSLLLRRRVLPEESAGEEESRRTRSRRVTTKPHPRQRDAALWPLSFPSLAPLWLATFYRVKQTPFFYNKA